MKSEPVTYNTRKPNRGRETGTAFVLLKSSLLVYRLSYLKGFLATCLSTGSDLFIPWIIRVIIDNLAAGKIYVPLHLILGAAVFRIAGMRWKRFGILGGAAGVEEMFRNDLVEGFLKAPVKGMHYISSGDFTSRLTRDVEAVSGFLGQGMYDIISTTVKMISALIIMLMIDPVLTLEALIPIVLLAFMTKTFSAYFHDRFRKIQEDAAALNDFVQKTIQSIEHIKARGLERTLSHSFADVTDRFTGGTLQLVLLQSLLLPSVVAMVGLAGVMMLAAGGNAVRAGRISLGDFAAFYSYLSMLLWPVISLGLAFASGERSRSALGRLDEIAVMAKQSDESMDPEEINIPQMEDSNSGRVELNGKNILECHSVRFRYPGLADPAVEAVSFNLKEGEKLLLTGPAASGKSTLLALLHGELTPESGDVSGASAVFSDF
jgi:ATP-binding cassette subfamily B protein